MSLKKNYGFNLLNSLLNIAFPIVTFPYAAKILSPDGIGEVQFIFSFAQYFAIIATFGLPIYGVKAIAEVKANKKTLSRVTSELLLISIILASVVLIVYLVTIYNIPSFNASINQYLIAGLLILLSVFNVDWFFSGTEQFQIIALRSALVKIIGLTLLFSLVKTEADTFGYLIFLIFIYAGNYILNFLFIIKQVKISFKQLSLKRHIKPLVLILSMILATTIYTTLDTVLLGFLSTNSEVGYYTAAVKLSKVTLPVLTGMGLVVIPRAAKFIKDNDASKELRLYSKSFSFLILLAIPMSLGIFLLSEEAILLFSGPEFFGAIADVKILAALPLLIGFGHFLAFQVLIPNNKNKGMFYSTVIGMCVFGVLCFLLVPTMGSTGTAIANSSTELVVTIGYLYFIPRRIINALPWKKVIYALIASLTFIPTVWVIKALNAGIIFNFVSSTLLCAFFYFLIQHYMFKEALTKDIIDSIKLKIYGK